MNLTVNRIWNRLHLSKPDLHVPELGDVSRLREAQVRTVFAALHDRDVRAAAWADTLRAGLLEMGDALRAPHLPGDTHRAIMQVISADVLARSGAAPLVSAAEIEAWYVAAAQDAQAPLPAGPVLSVRDLMDLERRSHEQPPVQPTGDMRGMNLEQRQAFLAELDAYHVALAAYLPRARHLTRQLLREVHPTLRTRYPNRSAGAHHGLLAALLNGPGTLTERVRQYEACAQGDAPSPAGLVAEDMLISEEWMLF